MMGKPSGHTPDIYDPPKQPGMEHTGLTPRESGATPSRKVGDEKQAKVKRVLPAKPFPSQTLPVNSVPRIRNPSIPDTNHQELSNIRSILKKSSTVGKEEPTVKNTAKKSEVNCKIKRRRKSFDDTNDTEESHADGDGEKKRGKFESKSDSKPLIIETRRGKTICPDSLIAAASSVANSIMRLAQSPIGNPTLEVIKKEKSQPSSKADEKDQEEGKDDTKSTSSILDRRRKPKKKVGEVESFANSDNPTVKNAWPLHCAFLAALQECSPRLIPALSANNEAAFLNAMWSCFWRGYRAGFQASVRELEASIAGKCDQSSKKINSSSTANKQVEVTEKPTSKQ